MIFYLTVPKYTAFRDTDRPLFVNRNALFGSEAPSRLPRARGLWALDSGGYMELTKHGRWTVKPSRYVKEVRRARAEIGNLEWAATLDWMTEENVLAKTGKSVEEHQGLTIESYLQLRADAPDLADLWLPVLQGQSVEDYLTHFEMFLHHGVDLRRVNMVGVGSVCRCAHNPRLRAVFSALRSIGLRRLHGFGVKQSALRWSDVLERPTRADVEALYHRAMENGVPYDVFEDLLRDDPAYGAVSWERDEVSLCGFLASADSAAWGTRARKHAGAVRAARFRLAELRGVPRTEIREIRGELWFGRDLVGAIRADLAGVRPALPRGPDDVAPALHATQMLRPCAERAAAWRKGRDAGRKPHESCNMCVPWALTWREQLRATLEPNGCWEETPSLRRLKAPGFEAQRAMIERSLAAARAWREHGPEHFGTLDEMPAWARRQALERRARELAARVDAGDATAVDALNETYDLLAREAGLENPPAWAWPHESAPPLELTIEGRVG